METRCWIIDLQKHSADLEAAALRAGLLPATDAGLDVPRKLGRIALRLAIGSMAGMEAARRPLTAGPWGKPQIPDIGVHFNLSHSGGMAAVAVSATGPVGIDIETIRALRMPEHRRRELRTAAERVAPVIMAAAEDDTRTILAWTVLESIAKCASIGVLVLLNWLAGRHPPGSKLANRFLFSSEGLEAIDAIATQLDRLPTQQRSMGVLCRPAGSTLSISAISDLLRST